MGLSLTDRLAELRRIKDKFNLEYQTIADKSGRNRTTVVKMFTGKDERYITESNIEAVEKGVGAILDDYRGELARIDTGK